MSDINRVFAHIDGFFDSASTDHCMALANVIGRCVALAHRGYHERDMENKALLERIKETLAKAKALGESPPESGEEQRSAFRDLAIEAMVMRRSVLPLKHKLVWKTLDPRTQLFDDEDQYSFAIYDTLADEIGKLLPDLQKIAVEVAWDADQLA